jgi:dTDP-4-amino-4,6-dideoxygalactose transaminase
MINCLDLNIQHQNLKKELFDEFNKVYDETAFSGGKYVEKFEVEFSKYLNVKHSVAVSNGTVALHLAMLALNIGHGDEVIIPVNSFIATAWGVSHSGAKPVFVDCDDTWNIDITKIEAAITKKTRAIIGVHLYGQPFNIDEVLKICKKYGIYLVEDSAQAQGAQYKGIKVGTSGVISCFSFYPGKNLGACGEGGGLTTNCDDLNARLKSLRNHGSIVRYYHDEVGYNYRMGGFEGASLAIKLKYLDVWNLARKKIAMRYREEINLSGINMQIQPEWADSVHHLFVITHKEKEKIVKHLLGKGINPAFHYPVPIHLQKAYCNLGYKEGDFPQSEFLAKNCFSLPIYPELSDSDVSKIIDALNSFKA